MPQVGIIANPISARDIRRIISHAGNLSINDRANIVLRMLSGLASVGVQDVVIMPENGGIRAHLMRTVNRESARGSQRFPELQYLDMPVTGTATDSALAAKMMVDAGVGAIIVLGGDGTNRVVVSACGDVPVAGVSTGTNNTFPELREPTITGMAVGLAVTGQVPAHQAYFSNKRLDITLNGQRDIALVDVGIVTDRFVGARAVWKTESFKELFVTFGAPQSIGLSSIVGLLSPLSRTDAEGRRVRLAPLAEAPMRLRAPIAPGLIEDVGIAEISPLEPDIAYTPCVAAGSVALDGEREVTFNEQDQLTICLRINAFRTVHVPHCMAYAATHGLLSHRVKTTTIPLL